MASKTNILVGLDIGTTNVTVVIGQLMAQGSGPARIDVIGVGTAPSRGLRKGVVINIESTISSISSAVSQAETMAGLTIHSVIAAISGSHIKGFNSHGIVGVRRREVSAQDVKRVIEAAEAVAIPLDREVLHVLPQEYIIDEQDGIREPLGISGVRLEAKVHLVTGAVASAQNVVKCANRCGLAVQDIVLASLASGKAVLTPEEQELGVCLVDIGGGTVDLTVYHNGAVRHTSVISVGGNHITNDIAAGLRTPILAAEEIKCKYGTALVNQVSRDETLEVPSTGGRPPRVLSKLVLAEIVEPRVIEMISLIQKDLMRAGADDFLTSGLVLTGGGANLAGICQATEQLFNLPVRLGNPMNVGGLTELINAPQYASAVGLLLWGRDNSAISRAAGAGRGVGSFFSKVSNWIGEQF